MDEKQIARIVCECKELGHEDGLADLLFVYMLVAPLAERAQIEMDEQEKNEIRQLFGIPNPPEEA